MYTIIGSKYMIFPMFNWNNMKLSVRTNSGYVSNWIILLIILVELSNCINHITVLYYKKDVNSAILHITFLERFSCHFFIRLNMWIYRNELVRLINQTSTIIEEWGNNVFGVIQYCTLIHIEKSHCDFTSYL